MIGQVQPNNPAAPKVPSKLPFIDSLFLFAILALSFTLASLLASYHYWFELLSHFKLQYFIGSLLGLGLLAYLKFHWWAGALLISLLINTYFVAPWYFNQSAAQQSAAVINSENMVSSETLKIVQLNLLSSNQTYQRVIDFIRMEAPDLFIAQEVTPLWQQALIELTEDYPFNFVVARSDNFGIAIMSKIQLTDVRQKDWGESQLPSLVAKFTFQQKNIQIATTHPLPPVSREYYQARNHQLAAMMNELNSLQGPLIVAGDLNLTMWSPDYTLLQSARLNNARQGFGVVATWPAILFGFGIPIDHILVTPEFSIIDLYSGANVGSDHLPLVAVIKVLN